MNSVQPLEERLAERLWNACTETRALGCYRQRLEQLLERQGAQKAVRQLLIYDEPDATLPNYDKTIRLPWSGDKSEAIQPPPPEPPKAEEEPPDEFEEFTPETEDIRIEGGKKPEDSGKENK